MASQKRILTALVLVAAIGLILLLVLGGNPSAPSEKPVVLTTFYPLEQLTQRIAGSHFAVRSLVPAGIEPHDYEPTSGDIVAFSQAKAFVTLGMEFRGMENTLIQSQPGVFVISASRDVPVLLAAQTDLNLANQTAGAGAAAYDPHIWVSPKRMKQMAENIRDGLIQVDPTNANDYRANVQQLLADLDALDAEFQTGLAACEKNTILTSHSAFGYLGADYGFKQLGIAGLTPETEPSPQQMVELANKAKAYNISTVFYESLVDPRVSQTIATEIGAQTAKLDPIEGTTNPNETYFSLMRENLNVLRKALECR